MLLSKNFEITAWISMLETSQLGKFQVLIYIYQYALLCSMCMNPFLCMYHLRGITVGILHVHCT